VVGGAAAPGRRLMMAEGEVSVGSRLIIKNVQVDWRNSMK